MQKDKPDTHRRSEFTPVSCRTLGNWAYAARVVQGGAGGPRRTDAGWVGVRSTTRSKTVGGYRWNIRRPGRRHAADRQNEHGMVWQRVSWDWMDLLSSNVLSIPSSVFTDLLSQIWRHPQRTTIAIVFRVCFEQMQCIFITCLCMKTITSVLARPDIQLKLELHEYE